MKGIEIKKKTLKPSQIRRLQLATLVDGNPVDFCEKAGVSYPSMRKARNGAELSEQIINKIIKAL